MTPLQIMYAANIIVAGQIGILSLFFPEKAVVTVFSGAYPTTEMVRLVGCLWLAIAVLSVFGLWRPTVFAPVLFLQLIYKGSWLVFVAAPAIFHHQPYPKGMAVFFLVWVLVLPLLLPWKILF